jgi:hypothetical protein
MKIAILSEFFRITMKDKTHLIRNLINYYFNPIRIKIKMGYPIISRKIVALWDALPSKSNGV